MYITKQQDFDNFLKKAKKADAVAVDTEFLRDKSYWPKLCLLQMAISDDHVLVDPFEVDITGIGDLLTNEKIVKIFHAPRQDVEILLHKTGVLPKPMFDTQSAASFLGHGMQIGYGKLVSSELGVKLSKSDSYTDWSMRPLSKSQIKYAEEDVTYLVKLYYHMVKKLKKQNRLKWVNKEVKERYLSKSLYDVSLDDRYLHLKRITSLKNTSLACAKELAKWREKIASTRNIPRRWVLNDDTIIELCKKQPKDLDELYRMRGIKHSLNINDCRAILSAIEKGKKYTKEECKLLKDQNSMTAFDKHGNEHECGAIIDMLSSLVKLRAGQNDIAPQVLASNSDIKKVAHGISEDVAVLKGWRKKLVGDELQKLMAGKIFLKVEKGELTVNNIN